MRKKLTKEELESKLVDLEDELETLKNIKPSSNFGAWGKQIRVDRVTEKIKKTKSQIQKLKLND